ncbi:RloB family protein [Chitinophaga rhizophila]|uniref:RloB family protein n=1 Tax=Chitinophaga rhizophila TaxID=2866212 RepID=A0ABS7G9J9_9BACT|nr:RloB family protein [Chitinophaga rhizophila]MBW8684319.1 RloB family protein [Chitinophaga rhizophila]
MRTQTHDTIHVQERTANQVANQLKRQRSKPPSLKRPLPKLAEHPTILIVCEGKNTEPSYFRKFRLSSATIKIASSGHSTSGLVKQAIKMAAQQKYQQVWCVFDKDNFPSQDFNDAIKLAQKNNFGVAWSNQAFEYWLILHFADHQGNRMSRKDYHSVINNYIRYLGTTFNGKDDKQITDDLFDLLTGIDPATKRNRTTLAISRAKRNLQSLIHLSPAEQESSTTVFRLVEEILKYVQ